MYHQRTRMERPELPSTDPASAPPTQPADHAHPINLLSSPVHTAAACNQSSAGSGPEEPAEMVQASGEGGAADLLILTWKSGGEGAGTRLRDADG